MRNSSDACAALFGLPGGCRILIVVAETVYNLFIYVNNNVIDEVGLVLHHLEGADEDKLVILKESVDQDYKTADRYKVLSGLTRAKYRAMERMGRHLELFEPLFQEVGAPADPLFALTAIEDGAPRIDLVMGPRANRRMVQVGSYSEEYAK